MIIQRVIDNLGDHRVCYFRGDLLEGDPDTLVGEVDTRETWERIREHLDKLGLEDVILQLRVLEETIPEGYQYAMVRVPVSDIRKDGRFRSERVHQLLFGEWVRVLDLSTDYCRVKDLARGYLGYAHRQSLDFCSEKRYHEIQTLPRWVVRKQHAFAFRLAERRKDRNIHILEQDLGWLPLGSSLHVADANEDPLRAEIPSGEIGIPHESCGLYESSSICEIKGHLPYYSHVPYLWGGCSTYGTDCSGFVMRLFDMIGRVIPRDADQQEKAFWAIEQDQARFGDLCFFPGHVGLFMGDGWMLHSNITLGGVTISNLFHPRNSYESTLFKTMTKIGRWETGSTREKRP